MSGRSLCTSNGDDVVYTPLPLARMIIEHFPISGRVLDPARGCGAFYDQLPDGCHKGWCEISQGRDFFNEQETWDWIITNPPFSLLDDFMDKASSLAQNVVFLATLNQTTGLKTRNRIMKEAGMYLREEVLVDTPPEPWPQSGLQLAAVHWSTTPPEIDGYVKRTDLTSHVDMILPENSRKRHRKFFPPQNNVTA